MVSGRIFCVEFDREAWLRDPRLQTNTDRSAARVASPLIADIIRKRPLAEPMQRWSDGASICARAQTGRAC
jgi:hypothetical protein